MFRILYVDDELELLTIGKTYLETNDDFIVDTKPSAEAALSSLSDISYDAIVSDYFMPDMDGLEFLRKVRSISPTIPFIIFTGHGDEPVVIEALNCGADFYMKKGYDTGPQFIELTQIIRLLVSRVRSDELLRKSEEKFRTIADHTYEWMYWILPDGTLGYISPSCETITGYTQEEFYSDPSLVSRIVHPDDKMMWDNRGRICNNSNEITSLDFRIIHSNGDVRWISHVCQQIYDSSGALSGRRISNRDVTKRKKAEEQLLLERNNFLRVFKAAPIGLILVNNVLNIVQANEAASELAFRDPAEIIGMRAGGGLSCIHSGETGELCGYSDSCPGCPLRFGIEEIISNQTNIHNEILPLTVLVNGVSQRRWLNINAEPVMLGGNPHVIIAIDDITEKRETEIALRESEEKFRTLSDSATAGILMYQDEIWTYANPAAEEISGYSQEELLSMHFWDIVHPAYRNRLMVQGKARQEGGDVQSRHTEIKIIRKNGEQRWIDLVASSVVIKQKRAGLVTAVDITERREAEERLAESEEKFRLIFENYIDMYYQTDFDSVIINISPSCIRLTGYSPDELIGTHSDDLYPFPEEKTALFKELMQKGSVYDYEVVLRNRTGHYIPVSISSHVIYDNTGNFNRIEGTIRDVSERRRMEDALLESTEHYRSLFQNMLEGFAYCRMVYDAQGRPVDWIYLEVNAAFDRLLGLSHVTGKLVSEVIPGIYEKTPEIFDLYNETVITGEPRTFEINFTPLGYWLNISVYRPEPGHFVAIFENITDKKNYDIMLHKLIADQQVILENVPVMIWYKDIESRFVKVNPTAATVFGKPPEEIEGRLFSEIFPDAHDRYYSDDLEVMKGGTAKIGIVEPLITAKGEHLWVQTDKVPLWDEKGDIAGILVVSTDITERKKAKDAISLANKKLNLLSSVTRHDIGNQLQGLFFSLALALEYELPSDVRPFVEKADVFAHNIERQMAFTRDYQDIGVNSPTWQDVAHVIRRAVKLVDPGKIEIHIDIEGVLFYADPLLEKVFHNLVDNAKRYGEKISGIWFSGFEGPEGYSLICADDGVGIPVEYKLGIFKREYFKHTGFGLNLSREILDMTGIKIVETGLVGIGARFEILVPKGGYKFVENSNAE